MKSSMTDRRGAPLGILGATVIAAVTAQPVYAASSASTSTHETRTASGAVVYESMVVTAERRSQTVQEVPAAISAFGQDKIEDGRLETMQDLQRLTPGFTYSELNGNYQMSLRGLGNEFAHPSGESGVVTNVDGVYYARATGLDSAFNDLERIEVLRGPQGTLYGRNATGGVLNLITRVPGQELQSNFGVTYGSRERLQVVGGIEGELFSGTNARLSGFYEDREGDQRSLIDGRSVNDSETKSVRSTVVTELAPTLEMTIRADYSKNEITRPYGDNVAEFPTGSPFGIVPSAPGGIFQSDLNLTPTVPLPNNGRRVAFSRADAKYENEVYGGSVTFDWDIADSWSLKSISAYRRNDHNRFNFDVDGSSANLLEEDFHFTESDQFTQELNLSGTTAGDIDWILGLYYYDERFDYAYRYTIEALGAAVERATEIDLGLPFGTMAGQVDASFHFSGKQKSRSASAFGQVTVPIVEDFRLIAGARYNRDTKRGSQSLAALGAIECEDLRSKESWDATTFRVGAEYDVSPTSLLYANVAKGFKAGGLNVGACGNSFDPEEVISYEIGSKNQFFDRRLTVNLDTFYYDYKDLQQNIYLGGGALIENAANATVYGAELDTRINPFGGFEVSAGLSWLHAEFDDFDSLDPLRLDLGPQDFAGNTLPKAPEWSANAAVSYSFPVARGSVLLQYELYHSDGWYGDPANNREASQSAYTLHNLRATYSTDRMDFGAFVENLGDEEYYTSLSSNGNAGGVAAMYGVRKRFGLFTRFNF